MPIFLLGKSTQIVTPRFAVEWPYEWGSGCRAQSRCPVFLSALALSPSLQSPPFARAEIPFFRSALFSAQLLSTFVSGIFFFFFFNDNGRNASIPSMFPFLALSCCDLLDAAKQRSLAGKPKAGRWADGNGGWDLSERRRSCLGAAHTLRVLATFWFEKGLQPLNYWELRGNRL